MHLQFTFSILNSPPLVRKDPPLGFQQLEVLAKVFRHALKSHHLYLTNERLSFKVIISNFLFPSPTSRLLILCDQVSI